MFLVMQYTTMHIHKTLLWESKQVKTSNSASPPCLLHLAKLLSTSHPRLLYTIHLGVFWHSLSFCASKRDIWSCVRYLQTFISMRKKNSPVGMKNGEKDWRKSDTVLRWAVKPNTIWLQNCCGLSFTGLTVSVSELEFMQLYCLYFILRCKCRMWLITLIFCYVEFFFYFLFFYEDFTVLRIACMPVCLKREMWIQSWLCLSLSEKTVHCIWIQFVLKQWKVTHGLIHTDCSCSDCVKSFQCKKKL